MRFGAKGVFSVREDERPEPALGLAGDERAGYEPPRLVLLGSLHDLTRGGDVSGPSDGFGAAGAYGSLSS